MKKMTSDEIGRAVVAAKAWRAVRVAGADKASYIEREAELDQATPTAPHLHRRSCSRRPWSRRRPGLATRSLAAGAIQRHGIAGIAQGHGGTIIKNAKRDDARDLLDQVPHGLRKRAAPDAPSLQMGRPRCRPRPTANRGVRQKQGRRGKPAAEEPPKAEQATPGDAAKEDASRDAAAAETAATDPAKPTRSRARAKSRHARERSPWCLGHRPRVPAFRCPLASRIRSGQIWCRGRTSAVNLARRIRGSSDTHRRRRRRTDAQRFPHTPPGCASFWGLYPGMG
jgi:hypothetical protein